MNLLLDTHAFIWWANEPEKLSQKALEHCQNSANTLLLSVASVWEMQIKIQLGKLKIDQGLEELILIQKDKNDLRMISIELPHVLELDKLPLHHKDPFDRLLIAQAKIENAVLVSVDQVFSDYQVQILW